jgi:protein-L-isoaspartate(D-aspartate) O-methyltransferase
MENSIPDLQFQMLRARMVERAIMARGVRSALVLDAMRNVPRERFLPKHLREFAYEDAPLPIEAGQTISQPYIVAFMTEALALRGGEKVLEIGAGSGYAAAVLSEIARDVYTVERHSTLAGKAATTLADLGYDNVHVLHGDGTLGWPEHAPFDAIIVAAGGPTVPESLKRQLKIGGRMVIPVGGDQRVQELVRVTRVAEDDYRQEDLADVRFVPLLGEEGWATGKSKLPSAREAEPMLSSKGENIVEKITAAAEPFNSIDDADFGPLLERIGDARVVLLGEATHGTSEFYRMRERISRELILKKGFRFVAIEGDWPDAARVDDYVRHFEGSDSDWTAFARFPTWMWRNNEVHDFVTWMREHNGANKPQERTAFHGLDLYSMYVSISSILSYLDEVDPEAAKIARVRYGCLTPWQGDPATYGHAALTGAYKTCERHVVSALKELMEKRVAYAERDGERYFDAVQNARLVANAERYYRVMYYGSRTSWNLRDEHMFNKLKNLLAFYGDDSKAIVWAHNSHVGDSEATEMASRGEYNIGHLCRQEYGDKAYLVGFGTNSGTVAAASDWDGPMEIKKVQPALPKSYEQLCHATGHACFMLSLRDHAELTGSQGLGRPQLERAIGVIYRPDSERASHYFQAVLPKQFDEYIWFDKTSAVTPLDTAQLAGLPDTYPFGV